MLDVEKEHHEMREKRQRKEKDKRSVAYDMGIKFNDRVEI